MVNCWARNKNKDGVFCSPLPGTGTAALFKICTCAQRSGRTPFIAVQNTGSLVLCLTSAMQMHTVRGAFGRISLGRDPHCNTIASGCHRAERRARRGRRVRGASLGFNPVDPTPVAKDIFLFLPLKPPIVKHQ